MLPAAGRTRKQPRAWTDGRRVVASSILALWIMILSCTLKAEEESKMSLALDGVVICIGSLARRLDLDLVLDIWPYIIRQDVERVFCSCPARRESFGLVECIL